MALSNAQYDEIMRGYQSRQLHNRHLSHTRMEEAFAKIPELKTINENIASLSVEAARKKLDDDSLSYNLLKKKIDDLKKEKNALIKSAGFSEDYFEPVYTCKNCKDTGYVNGQKCPCFKQEIINVVYSQSNIKEILGRENFSTFSYDYYSDEEINPTTGLSALDTAERAVKECRHFIDDFDNKPKNLFFYGDTGVGKTFLSNCVAKELLEKGYSVIYFTAFQLFDILSKGVFSKDADAIAAHQNIFDCDLLIIDDLGTEFSNSFTSSQLFLCVNERILRQKSTIISTNLNMNHMVELYSERTLSRISSNYSIIKLFGDDIRIKKRQMR
ncbi:MAG: ATP-binding protein [Agathobacter sp.]|nr:ATP-binding protein [Agathobacter sp.]